MIEFKKEWAQGMDGGPDFVVSRVRRVELARKGEVGQAIDTALAAVCDAAESVEGAVNHLDYIIAELTKAKRNIAKGVTK